MQIFSGRDYHLEQPPGIVSSSVSNSFYGIKAGPPPLEAILVIFGRRALNFFFCLKALGKNEK